MTTQETRNRYAAEIRRVRRNVQRYQRLSDRTQISQAEMRESIKTRQFHLWLMACGLRFCADNIECVDQREGCTYLEADFFGPAKWNRTSNPDSVHVWTKAGVIRKRRTGCVADRRGGKQ